MKKWLMLILAILLCVPVLAEEHSAIPAEIVEDRTDHIQVGLNEAVTKTMAELPVQPETYQTRAEVVRMSDDSYRWVVTVFDLTSLTDGWCVELDVSTGAVLASYTTKDGFFLDAYDHWVTRKGIYALWTPPEKMLFDKLYAMQPSYGQSLEGDISWGDAATRAAARLGIIKGEYDIGYGYLMGGDGCHGIWEICFVDHNEIVYVVNVDAVTGDILMIEPDEEGNG